MNNWMSSLRTRLRDGLGRRPLAAASAAETADAAENVVAGEAVAAPVDAEAPAAGAAAFAVFRRQRVRLVVVHYDTECGAVDWPLSSICDCHNFGKSARPT